MTRRIWTSIAAVALASTVALVAAASASAAGPSLSIEPSSDQVTFGNSISIAGKLKTPAGVSAAGHVVKLYEKRFPYRASGIIATAATAADGSYSFDAISPLYNSRYRATIGDSAVGTRSASKLVVVFPDTSLKIRVGKSSDAISSLRLRYASEVPLKLDRSKVTWYFHRAKTPRFVARDRTRAKEKRKGATASLRAKSRFGVPRGRYRFEVTFCIDVPKKRDIGLGAPSKRRSCPKSFPARSGRVAAERRVDGDAAIAPTITARTR